MRVFDTPYVYYEIDDELMVGTFKKGIKIDLNVARLIVEERLALTGNKKMVALVVNQGVVSISKEARDYLSSREGSRGLKAGAILLDSPFTSILGNFILSVSKPVIPARLFTNRENAIKWLQKFKN